MTEFPSQALALKLLLASKSIDIAYSGLLSGLKMVLIFCSKSINGREEALVKQVHNEQVLPGALKSTASSGFGPFGA